MYLARLVCSIWIRAKIKKSLCAVKGANVNGEVQRRPALEMDGVEGWCQRVWTGTLLSSVFRRRYIPNQLSICSIPPFPHRIIDAVDVRASLQQTAAARRVALHDCPAQRRAALFVSDVEGFGPTR